MGGTAGQQKAHKILLVFSFNNLKYHQIIEAEKICMTHDNSLKTRTETSRRSWMDQISCKLY